MQGLDRVSGGTNFDPDGTLTLRLPAGRYHLYSAIHSPTAAGPLDVSALAQPLFLLDRDAELMLGAARRGEPMRVRVPEQSAQSAAAVVLYERRAPEGLGLLGALVFAESMRAHVHGAPGLFGARRPASVERAQPVG